MQSHSRLFFTTQMVVCYWSEKKLPSFFGHYYRDRHNRDREKSSGQANLFNIWSRWATDRTSAQPQVNLSFRRAVIDCNSWGRFQCVEVRKLTLPELACINSGYFGLFLEFSELYSWYLVPVMDQIAIKTPNPKCRLFLKLTSKGTWRQVFICQRPPIPSFTPPWYTLCGYLPLYLFTQGMGGGSGGEPVRRLEGR